MSSAVESAGGSAIIVVLPVLLLLPEENKRKFLDEREVFTPHLFSSKVFSSFSSANSVDFRCFSSTIEENFRRRVARTASLEKLFEFLRFLSAFEVKTRTNERFDGDRTANGETFYRFDWLRSIFCPRANRLAKEFDTNTSRNQW